MQGVHWHFASSFSDMRREWAGVATCTDASPSGYGVCEQKVSPEQARSLGRWQERWRFRRLPPSEWKPRERWTGRDPFSDPLTVTGGLAEVDDLDNYVSNGDFPEVPSEFMHPKSWSTVKMGRWANTSEHITLKEGRALVIATRRLSRARRHRGKRHVVIVDNMMALAFSVCKGRSNNFGMLRVLQQLGAPCLAAELTLRPRWVPSEWNVSDGPSRGQISPGAFSYESSFTTSRAQDLQKSKGSSKAIIETEFKDCESSKLNFDANPNEEPEVNWLLKTSGEGTSETKEGSEKNSGSSRRQHREKGTNEAAQSPGIEKCECGSAKPVSTLLRQVQGLLPGERHPNAAFNRGSRRVDGRLLGLPVSAGKDSWRRRKISGVLRIPRPELQGQDASQQKSVERLAEGSSTTESTSTSETCHVWYRHADVKQEQEDHGADDHCQLRPLSSSGGSPRPEKASHCSTGGGRRLGGFRQRTGNQQQQHDMDGSRVTSSCQEAKPQRRSSVQLFHGQFSRRVCSVREDAKSRRCPPISTQTRGGDARFDIRSQRPQQCESEGPLEDRPKRAKVRKNWPCPTTSESNECCSNSLLPMVRTEHVESVCRTDPAKAAPLKSWEDVFSCKSSPRRFALEIFAGTARIASALHEQNVSVFPIGTCLFPSHNVLDPYISDYISNLIRQQRITLVWLGMPCTTFSRARRNYGLGPGPLRDSNNLWGLPHLKPGERKKLLDGNNLFGFTMHILELCNQYQIPFVLENPLTSMAWEMTTLQRFKSRAGALFCDLDFCQYGEIWKKPTRLMYKGIDISSMSLTCSGTFHRGNSGLFVRNPIHWLCARVLHPLLPEHYVAKRCGGKFQFPGVLDGHMFFP